MPRKTPLALVKDKFGEKSKLVEEIEKFTGDDLWVSRTNQGKGLKHVSNAKLLRLLATFSEVKEKFGTREKLIAAILDVEKRSKDVGWRERLSAWPVPRLYDAFKSAAKRNAAATAKAKGERPAAERPAAVKPAPAKGGAAKKTAAKTGGAQGSKAKAAAGKTPSKKTPAKSKK